MSLLLLFFNNDGRNIFVQTISVESLNNVAIFDEIAAIPGLSTVSENYSEDERFITNSRQVSP